MSLLSYHGGAYQLGYVTRDLDRALAFLGEKFGAEHFVTRTPELLVSVGGEQRPLTMRVGMTNIGDKQLEVIEPVSGAVEIYTDGIDFDRSLICFHHVGIDVGGAAADWAGLEKEVRRSGENFALSFAADARGEPLVRYAYVDTRPDVGHYTEYLWFAPSLPDDGTLPPHRRVQA